MGFALCGSMYVCIPDYTAVSSRTLTTPGTGVIAVVFPSSVFSCLYVYTPILSRGQRNECFGGAAICENGYKNAHLFLACLNLGPTHLDTACRTVVHTAIMEAFPPGISGDNGLLLISPR